MELEHSLGIARDLLGRESVLATPQAFGMNEVEAAEWGLRLDSNAADIKDSTLQCFCLPAATKLLKRDVFGKEGFTREEQEVRL